MQQLLRRPMPAPSAITQAFWDATREHRIAIQRCNHCSTYHHPPVPQCNRCRSVDLGWADVAGNGSVHEFTVVRQSRVQGMEDSEPYACLAVELDEQPGLLLIGNLVNASWREAKIGLRVEAVFEEIGEGYVLPQFQPAVG
jgi:uncharacterized OB-fold protein